MKHSQTKGIVLSRTDFGEADRIVTVLTPNYGKLRLMARGVRKPKSKLAGGIELFSVTDLTFIEGKGEIRTLISSRLSQHYGQIVESIESVQLGYELLKLLNKVTEDHPEPEYFVLLEQALAALDDIKLNRQLIRTWFEAQLLKIAGHSPNLQTDVSGQPLKADPSYTFDYDAMAFVVQPTGEFKADHIKALRLLFSKHQPGQLQKIEGLTRLLEKLAKMVQTMLNYHLQ